MVVNGFCSEVHFGSNDVHHLVFTVYKPFGELLFLVTYLLYADTVPLKL